MLENYSQKENNSMILFLFLLRWCQRANLVIIVTITGDTFVFEAECTGLAKKNPQPLE